MDRLQADFALPSVGRGRGGPISLSEKLKVKNEKFWNPARLAGEADFAG